MGSFSSAFKNLKSLPLLRGLAVLIFASCATSRPKPEPLSPEFRKFLVRWENEAPLCSVEPSRFAQLVQETPSGAVTRDPQKIVALVERIDWRKERSMRLEASRHFSALPANVSDADYALLMRFGCKFSASRAAMSALAKFETADARKAPAKRSMKAIEKYVDAGPATPVVPLMLQWSLLRELSISPYYFSRVPASLAQEMDSFAARLKNERENASKRNAPADSYESYVNFRRDAEQARELQKGYDAILFKLKPIFFR